MDNCYDKLNENGLLYLSFVEGNPDNSGFISGSSGDRTYFYYYSTDEIRKSLIAHHFFVIDEYKIQYTKMDNTREEHSIILARKNSVNS